MGRKPFIAGNWKMYKTISEAEQLARAVVAACAGLSDREVMIAPPSTSLAAVAKIVSGSPVHVAAQNVCWENEGAFTGEISPAMLKEVGCQMAIIGHSERRQIFQENDALINQRVRGALRLGITPVLCIGETLAEREADRTFQVLETQLRQGLANVSLAAPRQPIIAYEPVWAIGTGKTASESQAQEAHVFIRDFLGKLHEKNIAGQIRILYGGSVKPENIDILMKQEDIDGVLVGGASLKAEPFSRIIHFQ